MAREMIVEYMPLRTEGLITDFDLGKYSKMILETGEYLNLDENGDIVRNVSSRLKKKDNHLNLKFYKIYLIIKKDNNRLLYRKEFLKKGLLEAYPDYLSYSKFIWNKTGGYEHIYLTPSYSFTDIKNISNKARMLDRLIARTIYDSLENIYKNKSIDLMFKAPIGLVAKRVQDVGFYGSDGVKAEDYLIEGIRLVEKSYYVKETTLVFKEYYFPERHPDIFTLE